MGSMEEKPKRPWYVVRWWVRLLLYLLVGGFALIDALIVLRLTP